MPILQAIWIAFLSCLFGFFCLGVAYVLGAPNPMTVGYVSASVGFVVLVLIALFFNAALRLL